MKKFLVLGAILAINFAAATSHAGIYSAADSTVERQGLYGASVFESNNKIMVLIDGREIRSMKQLHAVIANAFKLPKSYGANLDALYDVLTDPSAIGKNWDITIMNGKYLEERFGEKGVQPLLDTLNEAYEQDHMNTVMYWM